MLIKCFIPLITMLFKCFILLITVKCSTVECNVGNKHCIPVSSFQVLLDLLISSCLEINFWEDGLQICVVIRGGCQQKYWETLLYSILNSLFCMFAEMSKRPCSFFLEGHCRRADCKFSHNISSITCRFWEERSCFKGITCPFLHGYPT